MLLIGVRKFLLQPRSLLEETDQLRAFVADPDSFHKREMAIDGRVVHILQNSFIEVLKRKLIHYFRTKTGNDDFRNRYIHQRFLIDSPYLKRGSAILVEHNINYGKVALRKGSYVRVRGEYIHTPPPRREYGRIHKTHEPAGGIQVLRR